MLIISCDPGLTGAIALIDSAKGLLACEDIPTCGNGQATGSMKRWVDVDGLEAMLSGWSNRFEFAHDSVHAAIERPVAMPSLPAQTIASQFDTFGTVRAVIARRMQPAHMRYVNPRDWKKFFGLKTDKDESIACALRIYPSAAPYLKFKKSHNRAESILIGRWLGMKLA